MQNYAEDLFFYARWGVANDMIYMPPQNVISADRRGLSSIVASVMGPKSANYQRTDITVIMFTFGCETGP
jgi:hypothetical protein